LLLGRFPKKPERVSRELKNPKVAYAASPASGVDVVLRSR